MNGARYSERREVLRAARGTPSVARYSERREVLRAARGTPSGARYSERREVLRAARGTPSGASVGRGWKGDGGWKGDVAHLRLCLPDWPLGISLSIIWYVTF